MDEGTLDERPPRMNVLPSRDLLKFIYRLNQHELLSTSVRNWFDFCKKKMIGLDEPTDDSRFTGLAGGCSKGAIKTHHRRFRCHRQTQRNACCFH